MRMIPKLSIKLISKVKWRLFQALTLIPKNTDSSISDLFYWIVNDEWDTFFDLSPTIKLFSQSPPDFIENILVVVFDANGITITTRIFEFDSIKRKTIKISELFEEKLNGHGTFAVFHNGRLDYLKKIGTFIAERGYLSFSHRGSKIRSYVHGNMDAVALKGNGDIEYLGNAFIWNRQYRLQYLLGDSRTSKIVLVNTYRRKLKFNFSIINANNNIEINTKKIDIPAGGVGTYDIPSGINEKIYLIIKSKLIMARPVVIDYPTQGVNVFHG
jgi:hypothetical protein